MLGSATSLPAVKFFCLYAGTAILFNFFFQVRQLLFIFAKVHLIKRLLVGATKGSVHAHIYVMWMQFARLGYLIGGLVDCCAVSPCM